jgi:hypothetical protein
VVVTFFGPLSVRLASHRLLEGRFRGTPLISTSYVWQRIACPTKPPYVLIPGYVRLQSIAPICEK